MAGMHSMGTTITVEVELQLWLSTQAGQADACKVPPTAAQRVTVELPEGSTVEDLVRKLNMPVEWVGLVVRDGKAIPTVEKLRHGDKITLFPPLSGG